MSLARKSFLKAVGPGALAGGTEVERGVITLPDTPCLGIEA